MSQRFPKNRRLPHKPRIIQAFDEDEPALRYRLKKQETPLDPVVPLLQTDEPQSAEAEGFAKRARGQLLRLEKIRKKRNARRLRTTMVCMLVFLAMVAYFTGAYGASAAFLGDMLESIQVAMLPGEGFPVSFYLPDYVTARSMAGGFAVLGGQDLKLYSNKGRELQSIQHNYSAPAVAVGKGRVALYQRGGTRLTVYSRSRVLFEHKYQDPILECAMSPGGMLAVFRKSSLTVYDKMFEPVFEWKTGTMPTAMSFADDNRSFAVAVPKSVNGALGGSVYLYTTDQRAPDTAQAVIESPLGLPLGLKFLDSRTLLVMYDSYCAVYHALTGQELSRYEYRNEQLQSWAATKDMVFLLFGDGLHSTSTRLVALDWQMGVLGQTWVPYLAKGLFADKKQAYVFTSDRVLSYQADGALLGEQRFQTTVNGMVALSDKILVLTEGKQELFVPPQPDQPPYSDEA